MFTNRKKMLRTALMGSAAVAMAGASLTTEAVAQDADEEEVELVVVTGSRIARSNLTAPQPLTVIGNEAIQTAGFDNLAEIFNELPQAGVPGISSRNSAFSVFSSGLNIINLRNLGSSRTLVLLDGRRAVSGQPGITAVDLNTVPVDFIERVDIVTGGASALYGSDAVSGVVNVIFKDDFEGARFRAQGGLSTLGGAENFSLSATVGGNFADGRGNAAVNITYAQDFGLLSRERNNTVIRAGIDLDYTTISTSNYTTVYSPSSFSEGGRFLFGQVGFSSNLVFDAQGNIVPYGPFNGAQHAESGFNRSDYRTISIPTERILMAGKANYQINDTVNFFMDMSFADVGTFAGIEPFPFASSNIFPSTLQGIPLDNPFVPQIIYDAAVAASLTTIEFGRRTTELAQRSSKNDRQTMRLSVGIEGDLNDNWSYDTSFTYGQTSQLLYGTGQVNVANFAEALNVEPDPANPGGYRCVSADARQFGCVPVNVFGYGTISAAAANYLAADTTYRAQIQQQVFAANITGSLFEMDSGTVALATGIEYRRESSDSIPDALQQKGLNASNAIPRTRGKYNVSEWYAEVDVPLADGGSWAEYAAIGGAIRIADYNTVGNVMSWNLRAEWQPITDMRFRVNYGQSVRAPNISELFSAPAQTFPAGLKDPCAGVTLADAGTTLASGALADNCLSDPLIVEWITLNGGTFTVNLLDQQTISGFTSGNPNLGEETADTFTASLILTPNFVPGLNISLDYYDIEITDAITTLGRQNTLDLCYSQTAGVRDEFCAFITRFASGRSNTGKIEFVNASQLNIGALRSRGIDVAVDYTMDMDSLFSGAEGTLNFNFLYSYVMELESDTILPTGVSTRDSLGLSGTSEHRWNSQLTYRNGAMTMSYSVRYIGEAEIFKGFSAAAPGFAKWNTLDRETYHDIQFRYRFGDSEQYEFFAGINNIFGNLPSFVPSSFGPITGCNSMCDTYDPYGRFIQAGVVLSF